MADEADPQEEIDPEHEAARDWAAARVQPGNWIDIAPGEEIPAGIKNWERSIFHMHQVAFSPEIRRRRDAGELPVDFMLWGCQMIQPEDGSTIIRLNQEVRGRPYLRVGRPVEKGEEIKLGDFATLEVFDLDDDELDAAHFTIFYTGETWVGSFDFRAGRAKSAALLEKALEYMASIRMSVAKGLINPSIDNLYTCCELVAKARLILDRLPVEEWKSHKATTSELNKAGRFGNIDAAFISLFNGLAKERNHAKYATGYEGKLPSYEDLDLVETFARSLQASVKAQRPAREDNWKSPS